MSFPIVLLIYIISPFLKKLLYLNSVGLIPIECNILLIRLICEVLFINPCEVLFLSIIKCNQHKPLDDFDSLTETQNYHSCRKFAKISHPTVNT